MEVEVLLDVLAYTLAQTEPMKIDDTLADEKASLTRYDS